MFVRPAWAAALVLFARIAGAQALGSHRLQAPTFSRDVAPILFGNCAGCHNPGGPGPFSLLTYADARAHANEIAAATASGFMPPFPPEAAPGTFQDEHRLSKAEIDSVIRWARNGEPEGDPAQTPPPPALPDAADWQLGRPDVVLEAAHPIEVRADGPDVFWNVIFRPQIQRRRYVRAVEIKPGNPKIAHHANLLVDRTGVVARREAQPGYGFPGMDLTIGRNPLDPESHFLFWKPGSQPYSEPPGLSWILDPGNVLVLNMHLQPSGKREQVVPKLGVYFTETPPSKFPILVQLERDNQLNIAPGVRNFEVSDDFELPEDVDLLAIYPHAHYLGTLLDAFAILPNGKRQSLIRIPHWDLNWQAVYRYRQPLFLPRGTTISMRFRYDNSEANPRNPNHPPKRVRAGNEARDEMSHLWLQILPRGAGDHRRPIQEAILRHRIAVEPRDAVAHVNLGALLLSKLDAQSATAEFRSAIQLDDSRPDAHDMLGAALLNTGRLQEAIAEFRKALAMDPQFMNAHYNLALALVKTGNLKGALPHLRSVAAAYPNDDRIQSQYRALNAKAEGFGGTAR